MKYKSLIAVAMTSALSVPALAETTSGVVINNTATLTYEVAGNAQQQVQDSVDFSVDRKVIFTVDTPTPAAIASATLGSQQVITYTLHNSSNAELDFNLSVTDLNTGEIAYTGLAADSTPLAPAPVTYQLFLDDGDGVFNPADAAINTTVQLAQDDDAAGGTDDAVIHVVITPTIGNDGAVFAHELSATALETDGVTALVNNAADPWNQNVVQTIIENNTAVRADRGAVSVASATLALTKTVAVVSDPFGSAVPKAVPGSVLRYTITVVNSGSQNATNVVISDDVPAEFDIATLANSVVKDNTGTDIPASAGVVAGTVVTFPAQVVPAGEQISAEFEVTLQ